MYLYSSSRTPVSEAYKLIIWSRLERTIPGNVSRGCVCAFEDTDDAVLENVGDDTVSVCVLYLRCRLFSTELINFYSIDVEYESYRLVFDNKKKTYLVTCPFPGERIHFFSARRGQPATLQNQNENIYWTVGVSCTLYSYISLKRKLINSLKKNYNIFKWSQFTAGSGIRILQYRWVFYFIFARIARNSCCVWGAGELFMKSRNETKAPRVFLGFFKIDLSRQRHGYCSTESHVRSTWERIHIIRIYVVHTSRLIAKVLYTVINI